MLFSNLDFTLKYLDPSATENGDGSSPDTPLNAFPSTVDELGNNTAWIIRRTAEDFSTLLPQGTTNTVQNILFIGMPKETDTMWELMPFAAQEAWGDDEAEYANIKADTGTDPWSSTSGSTFNSCQMFLLHRIYLFRDNTAAYSAIFKFPAQDYSADISIERCKFGCKGVDIDNDSYTEAVNNGYSKMYLNINTANVFSMHHCIVNITNYSDDYYSDANNPIHVNNANYFSVSDIDVYVTTNQYGGDYGPGGGTALNFSNGSWGGAYSNYQNLRFHILVNGTWGYLPQLFYSAVNDYCVIKNVSVDILERKLGTGEPTLLCVGQYLIRSHGSREFQIENISVNLPKCWRITEYGRVLSLTGFCNSTIPGHSKSIKNITINMAETDGIDKEKNGNYYEWVKYGTTDLNQYPYFSALEISFSEQSYKEGAWEPVVASGITVNHPHGVAMYAYGCQIRNCNLKGTLKLRRCVAEIEALESYYPGYALFAGEATTLRVNTLTLGKENAETTGGADDPAVGSQYNDASFIYVGTSNGALKSNIGETVTNVLNSYNVICGNEIDAGHYTCRSCNYICDTWNARRTGGAPATWKFTNSAYGMGGMTLGRSPFKGLQLIPTETDKHQLIMHIAAKGIASLANLNRQLLVQATIPRANGTEEVVFSSTNGQWLDDSDAEWVNDSELDQRKLVMPLEVTEANVPIDVKIHYTLQSTAGYVYIDPAMEISTIQ